jgi:hypothetical protein
MGASKTATVEGPMAMATPSIKFERTGNLGSLSFLHKFLSSTWPVYINIIEKK